MNFLSHARDVGHDPWLVAGVGLPDWLRVSDRRARVDPARLDESALARGARLHIDEDAWFHTNPIFLKTMRTIAARARAAHPGLRASFYAHVLLEMVLDAVLMERDPGLLDRYYAILEEVDPDELASRAEPFLRRPAPELARVFAYFRRVRFLDGYQHDGELLQRLRGLTSRLAKRGKGMAPLPDAFTDTIAWSRDEVRRVADQLLTPEKR